MSTFIARMLLTVSSSVSPFFSELLDSAKFVSDRVCIYMSLRRLFVCVITCIDDVGLDVTGEKVWRANASMAHHNHVDLHRQNVVDGVEQRLAFLHRAVGGREVDDVGR